MKNKVLFLLLALSVAAGSFLYAQKKGAEEKPYVAVNSWQEVVKTRGRVPSAITHPPYYEQMPKSFLSLLYKTVTGESRKLEEERKLCMQRQLEVLQAAKDNDAKAVVKIDSFKDRDVTSQRGAFVKNKAIKAPIEHAGPNCEYASYGSIRSLFYVVPYCKYHGAVDCPEKSAMLAATKSVVEAPPKVAPDILDIIVGVLFIVLVVKAILGRQSA